MNDKVKREFERKLIKAGFEMGTTEKGATPVLAEGKQICKISERGAVLIGKEDMQSEEAEKLRKDIIEISDKVCEYVELLERAPQVQSDSGNKDFKLLSQFNGVLLAGKEVSIGGYEFATWVRDGNGTGYTYGHYFGEEYTIAKEDFALSKAMERLGATSLYECSFTLESNLFNSEMEAVVGGFEENSQERLDCINHLAEKIQEIGTKEMPFINKLMIDLSPHTLQDMDTIFESAYEFELFDGIHTAEEYGRYMISDSGHFEYDDNLEEYIDFERYGSDRLKRENGAFTPSGYLLYHGCNQSLSEMLSEVGIEIEQAETQTLKLYMPLRATTYYEENFYGDMEQCDDEVEIDSHDLVDFEGEIMEAIEENNFPEESKRGLMEYYGESDSVNAKVKRYDFSVEVVDGKLMGVATAQLNAPLDGEEMKKLKQTVEGQCSDGWGEGFEQRDIECGDRDINVSFWQSKNWSLQTAEELGIEDQAYQPEQGMTMGGF